MRPFAACLCILALAAAGCCPFAETRYRGPESDHFDGEKFFNPWGIEQHDLGDLLKFLANRSPVDWQPDEAGAVAENEPLPERVAPGELLVTFVNHSTVLVQVDGFNVLTDPVWSEQIGPGTALDPRRKRAPGIAFKDLPPIDLVLVSHNHYDHMDLPTLKRLYDEHQPEFFVGLNNAHHLHERGIGPARELDWWQSRTTRGGLEITGVPAQHFSMRGLCDRDQSLWMGFVIRSPAGNVYFAGDTGWAPHFAEIGRRLKPIRLAMLPIGAAEPRWFMQPVHTDAYDVVRAHRALGAATSMAIHFGTFQQGDEGEFDPVALLASALLAAGESAPRFWVLDHGESRRVP
jgi:L-ascorbate metabolism protein UlaG (beta-lactamase superfamily)